MRGIIVLGCLLVLVHASMQTALWDDNCEETTPGFQELKNQCFHISCANNKADAHACQNDICPPGQHVVGKESDDNTKTFPACCGQLICENDTN